MGSAVERLTGLVQAADRYDIAPADLLPAQLAAVNERLAGRIGAIPLLASRAAEAGIGEIGAPADIVPLLFPDSVYKSYPESWLSQGRWDRMAKWLKTVSVFRLDGLDNRDVAGIDDWLGRLAEIGHYVSCSSGTTGKISMIDAGMADRRFNRATGVASFTWSTGLAADHGRVIFRCNPSSNNFRNIDTGGALAEAFGDGTSAFAFPGGPITIGQVREMVMLRRKIADGSALPAEVAAFDAASAARQKTMDDAYVGLAEALVAGRGEKLLITGMFAQLHRIAEIVRSLGLGGKDFHPENALMVGGGLKGATLPPDYRERILGTFNVQPDHIYQMYGMQEVNTHFPRCRAGRYHIAPWVLLLVLDPKGERLLESAGGEVEGRAAFFDLSHEGRWGGIISGDRVQVDYGACACGHQGPTVAAEIVRYADLEGGDNISCAGTVDAYIRGAA